MYPGYGVDQISILRCLNRLFTRTVLQHVLGTMYLGGGRLSSGRAAKIQMPKKL